MAEPNSKPRQRKPVAPSEPITRHPLFPAIVALWFAALVSVGSLALSTALLERLVLATGIDTVIAAAAPPLGVTARLAVALAFGLIGAAIGWFLAKRVAEPADKAGPQVFNVAEANLGKPLEAPKPIVPVLDPASLDAAPSFAANTAEAIGAETAPEIVTIEAEPVAAEPEAAPEPEPEPEVRTPTAAERIAHANLAELSHVELIERLAIALQRREALIETEAAAAPAAEASPVVHFPDFSDRRGTRPPLTVAASEPASRVAPQETEKALRDALSQLQRMSGTRG